MSDTTPSSTASVVVLQEEQQSFLTESVELKKLHKDLSKASKEAVAVLIDCMTDEKTDMKTKMTAASKILEFQISVAKEISQDQMQRLIAELRLNHGRTKKLIAVEDEDNKPKRPIVNFSEIREID